MQSMVCCILLLLFSIRCSCGSGLSTGILEVSGNRNALECLETLINAKYWEVPDFSIIFDDMDNVGDSFLQRFSNISWKLHSVRNNSLAGFHNMIFLMRSFDNFKSTLSSINIQRMDSRSMFVISVAENFTNLDEYKIASKGISEAMWNSDKVHVLHLVPFNEDILAMTYFPFAKNCQVGEFEVLDIWRGRNFVKNAELFPEKMMDIHGCVQNHAIVFTAAQALQLREEFTKDGNMTLGGVGGKLIDIVIEKMNMKLHTTFYPPESWHILTDKVARGESIFTIAGTIPRGGQAELLDVGPGYMEDSFGFGYIVDDLEVSFENLIWPLSLKIWHCILYTALLFCCLLLIAKRYGQGSKNAYNEMRILNAFGIFLGSTRPLPQSYFGRYLFGMWIIYSYLISTSYNSGLVSVLTTPTEKRPIETFEDLLSDGIDFGGAKFHREFYHDPTDPIMMKIYNNFKIWPENESISLLLSRRCVTGVLKSYVYMYNSHETDGVNHQLRMLKDKAITYQIPIPMRRGSPFAFGVRHYILRAVEAGFNRYWLKYYTRKSSTARIGAKTPTVISLRHVAGIFHLHSVCLSFSCLVFLGEIIFHKYFQINRG